MRKTIVVTGYAGYIGQVLCKMLASEGYNVIGMDKNLTHHPSVQTITNNLDGLYGWISWYKVDTIVHLAAKSVPIDESMTHPMRYYDNNVGLTSKMLNWLVDTGWKGNIVFASSASVYAYSDEQYAVTEKSDRVPPSHYGMSKLICEQILKAATVNDIWSVAFRFFNVAGAYEGFGDENPHVLSALCKAAKTGSKFVLNGVTHPTQDGTCVRDYVHVIDVCRAIVAAIVDLQIARSLEAPKFQHDPKFTAYNLGTKTGTSILELIGMVKEVSGKSIDYVVRPARAGDPPFLVADPYKFIHDYGFQYTHSDIKTIVQSAWEYHNGV